MVGRVTTIFGGVDVVPLLGVIVVSYGWGGGTLGEWIIAGCHWIVLWLGGRVLTNPL